MQLRSGTPDGWERDKSRGRAGRGVLSGWQGRGASIEQVRGARSFTEMVRVQTMTTTMAVCAGDRHVHPASRAACKSASRWAMPMSRAGQPADARWRPLQRGRHLARGDAGTAAAGRAAGRRQSWAMAGRAGGRIHLQMQAWRCAVQSPGARGGPTCFVTSELESLSRLLCAGCALAAESQRCGSQATSQPARQARCRAANSLLLASHPGTSSSPHVDAIAPSDQTNPTS